MHFLYIIWQIIFICTYVCTIVICMYKYFLYMQFRLFLNCCCCYCCCFSFSSLSLSDIIPESKLRARNSSSSSEKDEFPLNENDGYMTNNGYNFDLIYSQEAKILQEMFPDSPSVEVSYIDNLFNSIIFIFILFKLLRFIFG